MNIIGYIGTDAQIVSGNAPLKKAMRRKGWMPLAVKQPVSDEDVQALMVEACVLDAGSLPSSMRHLPWILLSADPADALRAWALGADFFLLLPIDIKAAEQAIDRIDLHLKFLEYIRHEGKGPLNGLDIHLTKGRRIHIPWSDILYLEADGELTYIYLRKGQQDKIVATRHLGHWEQQLDPVRFCRVHNKFIINLSCVVDYDKDRIVLERGAVVVAKRRRKEVEKALLAFDSGA